MLLWSDNMFRLLGLEPGAITPTPEYVIEQTHPGDRPRVEAEIEAARRRGTPPDVTYRVVLPNGAIRVLRGATTAVAEMSDGRPSRLIGSVQDLTDTVEAERKMAESLTLMEAMQSGAPVGFAFVDTDFRIVQLNLTLAEVNGSPAEDQVGKTVAEMVPDVWAQMRPVYERVLSSGEPEVNLEVERERGTAGDLRSWLSSYYPVRVEGEVIGIGVIVIDITDRTEAEHFRAAVMDTIVEGLYVLDRNGRLQIHEPRRREAARLERRGAAWQVDARGDPLPARRRLSPSRGGVRAAEGEDRAPRGADDARGLYQQGRNDHPGQLLGGTVDARSLARRRGGRLSRPQ